MLYNQLKDKLKAGESLNSEDIKSLKELSTDEYNKIMKLCYEQAEKKSDAELYDVFCKAFKQLESEYSEVNEKFPKLAKTLKDFESFRKVYHNKYNQDLNELMVYIFQKNDQLKTINEKILDRIYDKNIGLIGSTLHKYSNKDDGKATMEDLGQDCRIEFMKAIKTFDITKGFRFSTWATLLISRCVITQYTNKINRLRQYETSLETPIADDGGSIKTLMDYQVDERPNPEEICIKESENEVIYRVLNTLTMEQKFVAYCRFGLGKVPKKTQAEIANYMHMSQANVSKIENNMLKALKKELIREGFF